MILLDANLLVYAYAPSSPHQGPPGPTARHREILATLLEGETRHDVANDAHLAALAVEHGLTVCSSDRDFSRFPGIRWENPLAPGA